MWNEFSAATDVLPEAQVNYEAPTYYDVLPGGREVVIVGDLPKYRDFNHQQGDNQPYGYQGTCGLVSCQDVLLQYGIEVTESDVVNHAVDRGLCSTVGSPDVCGGTTGEGRVELLADYGIPAHVEENRSIEDLANVIEQDKGVIIAVNAGEFWDDPQAWEGGQTNHAVTPIGVARDLQSGELLGFYINDSGNNNSARFVDVAIMERAWLEPGGKLLVVDIPHPSH